MSESKVLAETVGGDVDHQRSKKFPIAVILIVLNEFCERFSYSGMRAFLALYLKQKLYYSDDEATEVYHVFSTLVYFFPLFGAILADGYLGKFRTILYLMVVYAIGNLMLAVTAIPPLGIPGREFTMFGLILVSLGAGGIKPCVSAFGGDQFVMPEQEKQLTTFFSVFYFTICMGSLIAKTVSPLLRSEIHCFGDKDCYSVAFGAPGILILSSILIFVCAKNMYIIKKPTENVVLNVFKCISKALVSRLSSKSDKKKPHWLDYARDTYDQTFIEDIKKTMGILLLFTPLPVFWSLLDQLGSRWTLQATKLDGSFKWFTVKPDQMQVLSPIFVLIFIPVFKKIVYPALGKYGIFSNSLHKLIAGCILAGISFIFSGVLEMHLEKTYPVLPSQNFGQIRIFNGYTRPIAFNSTMRNESFTIEPLEFYENKYVAVNGVDYLIYDRIIKCKNNSKVYSDKLTVQENRAISYFYKSPEYGSHLDVVKYEDFNNKSRSGFPLVRIISNVKNSNELNITLYNNQRQMIEFQTNSTYTDLIEVFTSHYNLYVNSKLIISNARLKIGGVYTIVVAEDDRIMANLLTITEPNSLSMVWVLPQMVAISMAEVLFAITGLEYAFKEAPNSMKSVLQAYWLLIEAFGNIIIIIVTRLGSDYRQVFQFFFFAALMYVATVIFYILMIRHMRVKETNKETIIKMMEYKYDAILQTEG